MPNDIITIDLEVKGNRDVINAQRELERMRKTLIQVAQAERAGELAKGSLAKATGQMTKRIQQATGDMARATKVVHAYKRSLDQMTDAQLSAAAGFAASGKGLRRMEILAQQTGYQLGDLAVQIQGGTNAAVALGQQGSQLLGFFGPVGALAGAALAISTAFIAPFIKAEKEANDLNKQLEGLGDTLDNLKDIRLENVGKDLARFAKEAKDEFSLLLSMMENAELKALEKKLQAPFKAVVQELKAYEMRANISAQLGLGTPEYQGEFGLKSRTEAVFLAKQLQTLEGKTSEELQSQLKKITEALSLRGLLTDEVQGTLITLAKELGIVDDINQKVEDRGKAEKAISNSRLEMAGREAQITAQLYDDVQNAMMSVAERQEKAFVSFLEKVREAKYDSEKLGKIDIASNINKAAIEASNLSKEMKAALLSALSLVALSKTYSGRGSGAAYGFGSKPGEMPIADPNSPLGKQITSILNPPKTGGSAPKEDFSSYMASLEKELELKNRLVGMTDEQATSAQRYFEIEQKALDIITRKEGKTRDLTPAEEERIQKLVEEEAALRRVTEAEQKRKSMMETIEGHITNGFMAMIDGSSSVEDAFKGMLRNILLEIYRQQVAQPIAKGIMALFSANGNVFQNGSHVKAFANGGVVSGATMFPMNNGVGVMGEAGPEAIMPLKRGPNGKLGVEASGGQQVVVNQSFNFAANGDESVKKIIAQAAPQIAQMTQKQIMDSRRRGGQMKAAFS